MFKNAYQRIYVRNFLMFTALFVIVFLPFNYFISTQFSRYAMDAINENAQTKVNDITKNSEYVFDKLKRYTISMYEDQSIQNWFFNDNDDMIKTMSAVKAQSNFMLNEPFIARSYIINNLSGKVIDSDIGEVSFSSFEDQDILNRASAKEYKYLIFFNHTVKNMEYLAIIFPPAHENVEYGNLILLIDKQKLISYIFGPNVNEGQQVSIMTTTGDRILGGKTEQLDRTILAAYQSHPSSQLDLNFKGARWYVHASTMQTTNWVVFNSSNYTYLTKNITAFQDRLILISMASLALIAVLFFWSSRRSLRSLSNLADKLKEKYHLKTDPQSSYYGVTGQSELSVIDKGIETLIHNIGHLNTTVRDHHESIRAEQLSRWLLQGKLTQSISDFLKRETQLLQSTFLYLGVIRIDSYNSFVERFDFNSRKLLKFAMRNIAEEVLRGEHYAAEGVDLGSDFVVIFISGNSPESTPILSVLSTIQDKIEQITKTRVSLAVSNSYSQKEDLLSLHQHIYEITSLKFMSGENRIYTESEYEDFLQALPLIEHSIDDLVVSIHKGDSDQAIMKLRLRLQRFSGIPYSECKQSVTILVYELSKSFNKLQAIQEIAGIHKVLDQFGTLSEVFGWLESLIMKMILEITTPKVYARKEEVVNEILEYINSHLQGPQLCTEEIAEHLSLSVSYLRQVFKEVTKTTLADYILEAKINLIKDLLHTTDLTMNEIMQRSGFLTKSHFFAAFKKITGQTPKQYREFTNG